jgi:DNA-binding response OmpR family regulator
MMRILIVEPNAVIAKNYRCALQAAGYQTEWRTGAQSAIAAADEHTPDMVILELQLPGHNGVEFLYEFCTYGEWQAVPVLIASSVPPHRPGVQGIMRGHCNLAGYYYKPTLSLAQLVAAVDQEFRLRADAVQGFATLGSLSPVPAARNAIIHVS